MDVHVPKHEYMLIELKINIFYPNSFDQPSKHGNKHLSFEICVLRSIINNPQQVFIQQERELKDKNYCSRYCLVFFI